MSLFPSFNLHNLSYLICKGKTVVVVGGGITAATDALLLSRIAKKVVIVHRRDTLRATKIYHEPLMKQKTSNFNGTAW